MVVWLEDGGVDAGTADRLAASDDYDHLLVYAHGGLNGNTTALIVSLVIISVGALIGSAHGAVRRDETATPLRLLPPVDADVIDVEAAVVVASDGDDASLLTPAGLRWGAVPPRSSESPAPRGPPGRGGRAG